MYIVCLSAMAAMEAKVMKKTYCVHNSSMATFGQSQEKQYFDSQRTFSIFFIKSTNKLGSIVVILIF